MQLDQTELMLMSKALRQFVLDESDPIDVMEGDEPSVDAVDAQKLLDRVNEQLLTMLE